jgi:uncharacterized low-complexity protein
MDKKLLLALSAGLAVSLAGTPIVNADTNPFKAQLIDHQNSTTATDESTKDSSGSCGTGKCAPGKCATDTKKDNNKASQE